MRWANRLARLETAVTGPGDGSPDLCPRCGGLTLEILFLEPATLEGGDDLEPQSYDWTDMAKARCRRCGQPTLSALLAQEFSK